MLLFEFTTGPGKYLYHVTFSEYIPSIQKLGLMQYAAPSNWVKGGEDGGRYNPDAGVFAFTHPRDAMMWAFSMDWDMDKPVAIVTLQNTGNWTLDPSEDPTLKMGNGTAVRSDEDVPASQISAIHHYNDFGEPNDMGLSGNDWIDVCAEKISS